MFLLNLGSVGGSAGDERAGILPTGVVGLYFFQFLNRKRWGIASTAASAAQIGAGTLAAFAHLYMLFAAFRWSGFVSSLFGFVISEHLSRPS